MTDNEQIILHDFTYSKLKLAQVIERLIKIGYSPQEAHDLANEWADGLEDDAQYEPPLDGKVA